MRFKFRVSAIFLSSLGVAACGSDSGPSPVDGGGRLDLQSQPSPSPLDAEWTLTDAGECMSPVWPPIYLACTLDEHPCGGISTCRSCNGALGLWRMMPVWPCACENATVNGATGLYWQCSSGGAVCQPGPGNFVDSQCTVPSVIDGGTDGDSNRTGTVDSGSDDGTTLVDGPTTCRPPSPTYGPTTVFSVLPDGTPAAATDCSLACGSSAWPASMASNIDIALPYGPCTSDTPTCSTLASIPCACGPGGGPTDAFNCACEGGTWTCRIRYRGTALCLPCPDASVSQLD